MKPATPPTAVKTPEGIDMEQGVKLEPWQVLREALTPTPRWHDEQAWRGAVALVARSRPQAAQGVVEAIQPVLHWYQSDERPERPIAEIVADIVADLQADRAALLNPPKHRYWGAGQPDCPPELKAGNGELHTLRCKICGQDSPPNPICTAALSAPAPSGDVEAQAREFAAQAYEKLGGEHDRISADEIRDGIWRDDHPAIESARLALSTHPQPQLVEAAREAVRKLKSYVGVCDGDKELTERIIPDLETALAAGEGE